MNVAKFKCLWHSLLIIIILLVYAHNNYSSYSYDIDYYFDIATLLHVYIIVLALWSTTGTAGTNGCRKLTYRCR